MKQYMHEGVKLRFRCGREGGKSKCGSGGWTNEKVRLSVLMLLVLPLKGTVRQ